MIERYILEIWTIVLDLGFPLLLGIVIAGVVHAILPTGFVHRNFGSRGLKSVIKATIIGVPLPLCSCGVIPTAVGLKQDGASDGASTSFLISTPQTGVDSILVSAAFLGWPFAIFKLVAAFITGIIGGAAVDLFDKHQSAKNQPDKAAKQFSDYKSKFKEAFNFGVFEFISRSHFTIGAYRISFNHKLDRRYWRTIFNASDFIAAICMRHRIGADCGLAYHCRNACGNSNGSFNGRTRLK